jgi:hypothetical protein
LPVSFQCPLDKPLGDGAGIPSRPAQQVMC